MPGPMKIWNANTEQGSSNFGTFTCLVRSRYNQDQYFALGSSHVLAPVDGNLQPSQVMGAAITCEANQAQRRLGTLAHWTELYVDEGYANPLDAALVTVDHETAKWLQEEWPTSGPAVQLGGGDSCAFRGVVTTEGAAGTVGERIDPTPVSYQSASGGQASALMSNLIQTSMISQHGDSGALIVDQDGHPAGILTARLRGTHECMYYHLTDALDHFGVELIDALPLAAPVLPARFANAEDPQYAGDILARTLWGEARRESVKGIRAVASVILNRVEFAKKRPTISQVCLSPKQFSCWNANDPNRTKLLAVGQADGRFRDCLMIADEAMNGTLIDMVNGARHYHTRAIHPSWATTMPCAEIGNHLFYNDIA